MEQLVGVDEARTRLGHLAERVAASGDPVVLTRRGVPLAVLISPEDYDDLQTERRRRAWERLDVSLQRIRHDIERAGLSVDVVDEAIVAARAAG